GYMFVAGGGYYSRAAVVEGPGAFMDINQPITLEMIDENIDAITTLEGAKNYNNATEQTGYALSKMDVGGS
ncbi:unnamed protein product, partial [marine sediment metagenome]